MRERIEQLEKSVNGMVEYSHKMLVVILIVELLAVAIFFFLQMKLEEFWDVDTRNIYRRIETLEKHHEQGN